MTFAIVGAVVDHTAEDGGLVVTSSKNISVEIRCDGELLGKLIRQFQDTDPPRADHMFTKKISEGEILPLQNISFVPLKNVTDFMKERYSDIEKDGKHYFVVCCQDDVKVISASVTDEGLLVEDVDPDSELEDAGILYSSCQMA
jgi:hypothetical protein